MPLRKDLGRLDKADLAGREIIVVSDDGIGRRKYLLVGKAGSGATATTYKANDPITGQFAAIKFVEKRDYQGSHSLAAECDRVGRIKAKQLASIHDYGTVAENGEETGFDWNPFYAIVVEWVEGVTFGEYLASEDSAVSVELLLRMTLDLCTVLQELEEEGLSHDDLHDANLMVVTATHPISQEVDISLKVIDTGTIKTLNRKARILDDWRGELKVLEGLEGVQEQTLRVRNRIKWFSRTDYQWLIAHVCSLLNSMRRQRGAALSPREWQFIKNAELVVPQFADEGLGRRDPRNLYLTLRGCLHQDDANVVVEMVTPFDLISAELIRSNATLYGLFSDQFPGLDDCRGPDPVYIKGPRGCGKSTVLRVLSMKAILNHPQAEQEVARVKFIGVYVSCVASLRARFLLFKSKSFEKVEREIVHFFTLVLVEELVETLESMSQAKGLAHTFGFDAVAISSVLDVVCDVLCFERSAMRSLDALRFHVRRKRNEIWRSIVLGEGDGQPAEPHLIFDICDGLSRRIPFLSSKKIAFLIDDYSNQRIPAELQRRLNRSITFSRQANPIFKVTSEYRGVDLDDIQEGREVRTINVGSEYMDMKPADRWKFLANILNRRFDYLESELRVQDAIPPSGQGVSVAMAAQIRKGYGRGGSFFYHGIDTISELCSGDFGLALDLVHRIWTAKSPDWRDVTNVSPAEQHEVIKKFAGRELDKVQHRSPYGVAKWSIMDALCWYAGECVREVDERYQGRQVPAVRIHIDVKNRVFEKMGDSDSLNIFWSLVRDGALIPLSSSRTRQGNDATRRFQIRRIFLPQYLAPLGRRTAIKIDGVQQLEYFITEPKPFLESSLRALSGQTSLFNA